MSLASQQRADMIHWSQDHQLSVRIRSLGARWSALAISLRLSGSLFVKFSRRYGIHPYSWIKVVCQLGAPGPERTIRLPESTRWSRHVRRARVPKEYCCRRASCTAYSHDPFNNKRMRNVESPSPSLLHRWFGLNRGQQTSIHLLPR